MQPAEGTRRGFLKQTGLIGIALLADPVIGRGRAAGPSTVKVRKGIDEFVKDPASLEALRAGVGKMRSLEPDHPFS